MLTWIAAAALAASARAQGLDETAKKAAEVTARPRVLGVAFALKEDDAECLVITRRAFADRANRPGKPGNPIRYVLEWYGRERNAQGDWSPPTRQQLELFSVSAPDGKPADVPSDFFKTRIGCKPPFVKWPALALSEDATPSRGVAFVMGYGYLEGESEAAARRQCAGPVVYWGMDERQADQVCRTESRGGP